MRAHERLKLGDHLAVAAQRQIRVDAVLQRRQARLLQAGDLTLRERLVPEIRKRRAAPQTQRLPQARSRRGRVTARKRGAPVGRQPLELIQVKLARRSRQNVAAATGEQDISPDRLAQAGNVGLKHLPRGRRSALPPQLLNQPLTRDHLTAVQQQNRQHRALPGTPQRPRNIPLRRLKRTENPELHRSPPGSAAATAALRHRPPQAA